MTEFEDIIKELESKLADTKSENADLRAERERLKRQIDKTPALITEQNGRLSRRCDELERQLVVLRADRDCWRESESVCDLQYNKLLAEKKELERQLAAAHDHAASMEHDCRVAEAEAERLRPIEKAARLIRHWHDSGTSGMIVSSEKVRGLWDALHTYDAAVEVAKEVNNG